MLSLKSVFQDRQMSYCPGECLSTRDGPALPAMRGSGLHFFGGSRKRFGGIFGKNRAKTPRMFGDFATALARCAINMSSLWGYKYVVPTGLCGIFLISIYYQHFILTGLNGKGCFYKCTNVALLRGLVIWFLFTPKILSGGHRFPLIIPMRRSLVHGTLIGK